MGSQIISRQLIHREGIQNGDNVIAFVPMPPGTRLNNVWLDVSVLAMASFNLASACMYGVSGFVVDIDDPDASTDYDAIWDRMIEKDVNEGHDILSIDTGSSETLTPYFDVGKLDLFAIFGTDLIGNMQIFQKRELLTYAKRPIGYDPSNDTYFPQDAFKIHIKGGPKVSRPSVAMFGFSSPGMANTTAISSHNLGATPTEQQWLLTMYSDVFIYDMWKHLIGVTPSSTTDPYDDVSAWFAKLLEDNMYEEGSTNRFIAADFHVHTKATWDITVVGKPGNTVLTSD